MKRRLDSVATVALIVTCLTMTSFLHTEAEVCFRKFVEGRRACRGRMRSHHFTSSAQGCCRKHGQGYAEQPIRVNFSKNWFECTPCHHDNETSSEFPVDFVSSAEIPLSEDLVADADSRRTTPDNSRSFVYNLHIGWTEWSEWSLCSASCGEGSQVRTRSCKISDGGKRRCQGLVNDVRNCTAPSRCTVDGGWSEWSVWSTCRTSCDADDAIDQQTRSRRCDSPRPANGGRDCLGPSTESHPCPNIPCPVDGQWSSWSAWTSCSADCGEGVETRSRTCTEPAPQYAGRPCQGLELESMPCVKRTNCPVDGGWSAWSRSDVCSAAPCSGRRGHRTHFRSCTDPRPMFGGKPCRGRSWKVEPCYNNEFCTDRVDGEWCEWSQWSECYSEVTSRKRSRRCECPPPANAGQNCQGYDREEQPCSSSTDKTSTDEGKDKNITTLPNCTSSDATDIECDLEQEQLAVDEGSATEDD